MCLHACVCAFVNFFFKKTSSQKLLTGLLPNFIVVFLRKRLKSSLHCYRKISPVERYRHSSASSFLITTLDLFQSFELERVVLSLSTVHSPTFSFLFLHIVQLLSSLSPPHEQFLFFPQCFLLNQNI